MARYNEVLTAYERYQLGKKYRMSDILRGQFFSDNFNWSDYKGRGVVRHSTLDNGVEYVNCYNFEKYNSLFTTRIYCNLFSIDDIPAGLMVETVKSGHNINVFLPCHDYEDCNINRICVRINQGMENKYSMRHPMEENEQRAWNKENSDILFQKHLEFDSDFITQLWQKLNVPMTKEQMDMYRDTIDSNWDKYTQVQKDKIAKEIIFYILPQITSYMHMEEMTVVEGFCKFIAEKYDIGITAEVDSRKRLSLLKEHFLINTIEKAKEYYIANECSVERYKDFCLKVDYDEIMDSFEQWDISQYKEAWTKEALERCFDVQDILKDWNVERILRLIEQTKSDVSVFHKLKDYIQKHIDDIYVRDVLISHVQDLMDNNNLTQESLAVLRECCDKLQGFETRKLNLEEDDALRRMMNDSDLMNDSFNYINTKRKIIVIRESTRIRPARDPQDPRFEWYPKESDPRIFSLWGNDGLIGKLEVVENHIIWNMIGEDKAELFSIFSEFVRTLEIIAPETEVRYATKDEADYWEKETLNSCIENKNFFGFHSEWSECTGQALDERLLQSIVQELKGYEEYNRKPNIIWMSLLGYIIPSMKDNPLLCKQDVLDYFGHYLKITSKKFVGKEILASENSPDVLLLTYQPFCMLNSLDDAKRMYKFFNCNKSKYRRGTVYFYNDSFYENLWNSFNMFDFDRYEKEWKQEVFDETINNTCNPCFVLDLLESVGTTENFEKLFEVSGKYRNKEYVRFRLLKMYPFILDEPTRTLVKEFCDKI